MGFPIITMAVGAALGSLAAYVAKDQKFRHRLAEDTQQIGDSIGHYVGGLFGGGQTAVTEVPQAAAGHEPDRERCEALTKTGQRCRARTNKMIAFPSADSGRDEHGLCWRHAREFEQGNAVQLADTGESSEASDP